MKKQKIDYKGIAMVTKHLPRKPMLDTKGKYTHTNFVLTGQQLTDMVKSGHLQESALAKIQPVDMKQKYDLPVKTMIDPYKAAIRWVKKGGILADFIPHYNNLPTTGKD